MVVTVTDILVSGDASGSGLVLTEPLSFWGGVDPGTGEIVEKGHPQFGERLAARVVFMPGGRGSSSASSVLAELLRIDLGPAALVLKQPDPILMIGSLVAERLYGAGCPIIIAADHPDTDGEWAFTNGLLVEKSD